VLLLIRFRLKPWKVAWKFLRGVCRTCTGAGFHPFSVDGGGTMNLSAGLAGMPEGFTLKSVSCVTADSVGRALTKIRYIGHSNAHDVMDAVCQK